MRAVTVLLCAGLCLLGCADRHSGVGDESSERPAAAGEAVKPATTQKSTAESTLKIQLFSAEAVTSQTPLPIAIETLGGVSTVLIPRGSALPATQRETFSTASDNQTSIEIHVVAGGRPIASDNATIGRFRIQGIRAARRGEPSLVVEMTVDEQGFFSMIVTDETTGRSQEVAADSMLERPLALADVEVLMHPAKSVDGDSRPASDPPAADEDRKQ